MKFSCEKCGANYLLPDEKIGERGVRVRCKKCGHINLVQRTLGSVATDAIAEQALGSLELKSSQASTAAGDVDFQDASKAQMDAMFDSIFQPGQTQQTLALGVSSDTSKHRELEPAPPLVQKTQASEPETEPEPESELEREWWIAVDNQQVGPLAVDEVRLRVEAGVIMATTLVWRAGMEGWGTLESQPELAELLPVVSRKVSLEEEVEHDEIATEIRLGAGASEPRVAWRPSAASELSELVQAELELEHAPAAAPSAVEVPAVEVPAFTAPTGGTGFDKGAGTSLSTAALLVVLIAGGGALAWQNFGPESAVDSSKPTVEVTKGGTDTPVASKPVQEKADSLALTKIPIEPAAEPSAKAPAAKPAKPVAKASAPKKAVKKSSSNTVKKKASTKKATSSTSAPSSPKKSSQKGTSKSGGALAGVFDTKAPVQARLSQKEIKDGFGRNTGSLSRCIQNAINNREVTPGQHTLELSWDILPNGKVSGSRMVGPYYLQGTSLPKCLVAAMRNWRFGKSREGNKIEKWRVPFNYDPNR